MSTLAPTIPHAPAAISVATYTKKKTRLTRLNA